LAAGTGSQLLLYEVGAARLVASFRVFDGVRIHGIEPRSGGPGCPSYTIALFGERRVKLFSLGFGVEADGGEARRRCLASHGMVVALGTALHLPERAGPGRHGRIGWRRREALAGEVESHGVDAALSREESDERTWPGARCKEESRRGGVGCRR
jgi:hypothetical protein